MKTYTQFFEDLQSLDQKRQQLSQRQRERVAAYKKRISSAHMQQQQRMQQDADREALKKEIKRELQSEQSPTMVNKAHPPNPYNVMIARDQETRKRRRETHAQSEINQAARMQQSAKFRRLKAIMSRPTST